VREAVRSLLASTAVAVVLIVAVIAVTGRRPAPDGSGARPAARSERAPVRHEPPGTDPVTRAGEAPGGSTPVRADGARVLRVPDDGFPEEEIEEAGSVELVVPVRPAASRLDVILASLDLDEDDRATGVIRDFVAGQERANVRLTRALGAGPAATRRAALADHAEETRGRVARLTGDLGPDVAARVLDRVPCIEADPDTGTTHRLVLRSGRLVEAERPADDEG
jgi:hypothetical protein